MSYYNPGIYDDTTWQFAVTILDAANGSPIDISALTVEVKVYATAGGAPVFTFAGAGSASTGSIDMTDAANGKFLLKATPSQHAAVGEGTNYLWEARDVTVTADPKFVANGTLYVGAEGARQTEFKVLHTYEGAIGQASLPGVIIRVNSTLPIVESRAVLANEDGIVTAGFEAVLVMGYAAWGDCPPMMMRLNPDATDHPGVTVDDDGNKWEIAEPSIDPRQFGATHDPTFTADSTTGMADCIEAAAALGVPVVGWGSYYLAQGGAQIVAPDDLTMMGRSQDSFIVKYHEGTTASPKYFLRRQDAIDTNAPYSYGRLHFENFTILGTFEEEGRTPDDGGPSIYCRSYEQIVFRGMRFENINRQGFVCEWVQEFRCEGCSLYNIARGAIYFGNYERGWVTGNVVVRNGDDPVSLHTNIGFTGRVPSMGADVSVTGNIFINCGGCIKSLGGRRVAIADNLHELNNDHAIFVGDNEIVSWGMQSPHSITVTGNVCLDTHKADSADWVDPESTVTITIANPGVITWGEGAHGLDIGDKVVFTTTGALPTGITAGTTYYVESIPSTSTFTITDVVGGDPIETTGAQSGTHTATVDSIDGAVNVIVIEVREARGITDGTQRPIPYRYDSTAAAFVKPWDLVDTRSSVAENGVPHAAGVVVANNVIRRTRPNVANFDDYGYGTLVRFKDPNRNPGVPHVTNPAVTDAVMRPRSGIDIRGPSIDGFAITGNSIAHTRRAIGILAKNLAGDHMDSLGHFMGLTIANNSLIDFLTHGVYIQGPETLTDALMLLRIADNLFNGDVFRENPNSNLDGTYDANGLPQAIGIDGYNGAVVEGNQVLNVCAAIAGSGSHTVRNNVLYCGTPAAVGSFNAGNVGIGLVPYPGFGWTHVIIGADPSDDATYMEVVTVPVLAAIAQPSAGTYVAGHFVQNSIPNVTGTRVLLGWMRLTTGSGHVANTDWAACWAPNSSS